MPFLIPLAVGGVSWVANDFFDWWNKDEQPAGGAGQYPGQLVSPGIGGAVNLALLGLAAFGAYQVYKKVK